MEDYRSEFEAPPYTVLGRRIEGPNVITTVLLDGEVAEFQVDAVVAGQCREPASPSWQGDVGDLDDLE